jgi:creatinine amidohydrolase
MMVEHPELSIKFHSWWNAPKTWAKVLAIDPAGSHANWMENFPWTRLAGVALPQDRKPMVDLDRVRLSDPPALRALLGDGNYGGYHQRPDAEMDAIWTVAVQDTRETLERPWA